MPFRFNYTGRQRIVERDIDVRLISTSSATSKLMLGVDLRKYGFPLESGVKLEANTRGAFWVAYDGRTSDFDSGMVDLGSFETWVSEDEWDSVRFRLKVYDRADKKLLGRTTRTFPLRSVQHDDDSLLRSESRDIGELIYLVDYDDDGPIFVLSKRLWEFRIQLMADLGFRSVVLPDIVRQVLRRIIDYNLFDPDDGEANWSNDWIDWMQAVPDLMGAVDDLESLDGDDPEQVSRWIEDILARFAAIGQNRFATQLLARVDGRSS